MIIRIENLACLVALFFLFACEPTPVPLKSIPTVKSKPDTENIQFMRPGPTKKDDTTENSITEKFFYPKMSRCGGALCGIYSKGELIRIESTFSAELGYSSRNVDLKNGRVVKIVYREHFAEWEKYSEKHPSNEEFDAEKMTYTDTLYVWETGSGKSLKKYSGKRLIGTAINEELVDRLFDCIEVMKTELASEKIVDND